MKQCHYCGENIKDDALKCRYCREWLVAGRDKSIDDRIKDIMQSAPIRTEFTRATVLPTQPTKIAPLYIEQESPKASQATTTSAESPIIADNSVTVIIDAQGEQVAYMPKQGALVQDTNYPTREVVEELESITNLVEEPAIVENNLIEQEKEILATEIPTPTLDPAIYNIKEEQEDSPLYRPQEAIVDVYEEEQEKEEQMPLPRHQSFAINKVLAVVLLIFPFLQLFVWYLMPKDSEIPISLLSVPICTLVLTMYILYELYKYLHNFDVFDGLLNYMKTIFICLGIGIIGIVVAWFVRDMMIVYLAVILPFAVAYIAALILGWKLWRDDISDYIEGLDTLGLVIFISVFVPVIWLVVPFFLYKVFSNAAYYVEAYGYSDEW